MSCSSDELARAAHSLIHNWQRCAVPQADWHQAEELLCDMHAIDEERATRASERLGQEHEKWRRYEAFKVALLTTKPTPREYERAISEYCREAGL